MRIQSAEKFEPMATSQVTTRCRLRQLVPAEEHQADEGRLEEEGHEPLDGERRTEDVADIVAVVAPVHTELEFHGDAGRDAEDEVDAEQRGPEFRHLPPDRAVGHHIDRLHDRHDDRQTQRERHEEEVIHSGHRELQSRQFDHVEFHVSVSFCLSGGALPPGLAAVLRGRAGAALIWIK
jgi:hypothetical protein